MLVLVPEIVFVRDPPPVDEVEVLVVECLGVSVGAESLTLGKSSIPRKTEYLNYFSIFSLIIRSSISRAASKTTF